MAEDEQMGEAQGPREPMREEGTFQKEVFETLKMETINYGTNNFIEIARKKTSTGNVFLSISKGWYPRGSTEKRYTRKSVGFPNESELVGKFLSALNTVIKE